MSRKDDAEVARVLVLLMGAVLGLSRSDDADDDLARTVTLGQIGALAWVLGRDDELARSFARTIAPLERYAASLAAEQRRRAH